QLSDLPQSREEHEIGWPEPAVGSRHHLCHNRDWLCVLGCDPRCLVPSGRKLRHQPLDRCTARCCCAQGRHQRPQSAKGLRASFRPWVAVCLRRLSRRLAKARSHRLHGPARQSLRQRQGRELHEDTQGRSRVSDGIRNLRGRYSRPSPLHRRGLQHSQTPLRARISEPGAIRGSPRPATCQNRRLKLSTIKGALNSANKELLLLTQKIYLPSHRPMPNLRTPCLAERFQLIRSTTGPMTALVQAHTDSGGRTNSLQSAQGVSELLIGDGLSGRIEMDCQWLRCSGYLRSFGGLVLGLPSSAEDGSVKLPT